MLIRTSTCWRPPAGMFFTTDTGPAGGGADTGQQQTPPAGTNTATTAGKDYTPPATQADFDEILEKRLSRERAKYSNYDELVDKAAKHDALTAELGTDMEKAVAKAREEERTKANGEFVPRLVTAEFKAAAKGVLSPEQLTSLLEDLDLSKYVNAKGEPDDEKISKKVGAFAPAGGTGQGQRRNVDLGQGHRSNVTVTPGDGARAALAKRGIKID